VRFQKYILFLLFAIAQASAQSPVFRLGTGIGIPYGGLGGNAELGIEYASVVAGLGYPILGLGWSVGGKVYAASADKTWRPHATVVYGTTVLYELKDANSGSVVEKGAVNGMAYYLGVDQDVARPGGSIFTYGIGYITHGSLPAGLKESDIGIPVKIIFGWNYQFRK
jgi:hypothetical protein